MFYIAYTLCFKQIQNHVQYLIQILLIKYEQAKTSETNDVLALFMLGEILQHKSYAFVELYYAICDRVYFPNVACHQCFSLSMYCRMELFMVEFGLVFSVFVINIKSLYTCKETYMNISDTNCLSFCLSVFQSLSLSLSNMHVRSGTCKNQNARKSTVKRHPRNECVNHTETAAIDTVIQKEENCMRLHHKTKNCNS